MGFETNNDLFEQNSQYFRNALVRANYQNLEKDIPYTMKYLNRFFGNLLLGKNNILDSKEMRIPEKTTQKTTQKTEKTTQKILDIIKNNPQVTRKELAELVGITADGIKWNLEKLKKTGKIRRIGPDKGGKWDIIEK